MRQIKEALEANTPEKSLTFLEICLNFGIKQDQKETAV